VKHRRFAVAGVGALAIASLTLAACSSTSNSASAGASSTTSASPSVAPADALVAAATSLNGKGYDMTLTAASVTGKGSVDPTKHAVTFDAKASEGGQTIELNLTGIGSDLWAKIDLGALNSQVGLDPSKWLKIDATKVDESSIGLDLSNLSDVLDIGSLTKAVSNVKRTDATHLTGTIDLTNLTGTEKPDADALKKAGAAAKSVPFTATLDDQGRLSDLKINGDSIDSGLSVDIAVSNVGSPTAVTPPPAADVVPAPAAIYQILGGK
jgi:hypothetical protein